MGSHEYNEPDKIGSHIASGPRLVRCWLVIHLQRLAGGRCDAGLRCSIAWRLCHILGAQSYKGDGGSNMLVYGQHRSDMIPHLK
jgi:hypothetical protein